jgi:hypothetical protein
VVSASAVSGARKGLPARPAAPFLLTERFRPLVLAREELLPVAPPFAELLGTPGLRRGSTLAVTSAGGSGATSLALAILAGASREGAWCALVGTDALGTVAAHELGVAFDRLVIVPRPGRRVAAVAAALLDGCDIVAVAAPVSPAEHRKLAARARERRSVLVSLHGLKAAPAFGRAAVDGIDVRLAVTGGSFEGLGRGSGCLRRQRVEVVATRRSAAPREVSVCLLLTSCGAETTLEMLPDEQSERVDELAVAP